MNINIYKVEQILFCYLLILLSYPEVHKYLIKYDMFLKNRANLHPDAIKVDKK